ncbi:MAG: hypothetical protein MRERC_6c013 [Mycoplasmataceae bacterium RC_NB112A]|nr:MAG: hypothetical protein MRERC_13c012 [Mycoplasmataceae bacterium RC_NB112A]KLL01932.1 MAG: hypothetical protein MRERC_6c013 [Mycoplasmataceae bacterium RC_NB112A]
MHWKKYCSGHSKKCPNCQNEEISIFDESCSNHGDKCKWDGCRHIISGYSWDNKGYCSNCRSKKRKKCNEHNCDRDIYITDDYCDLHERHNCRLNGCLEKAIGRGREFCFNHTGECQDKECYKRISSRQQYCPEHKYCYQENNCQIRISRNNNYCSQHVHRVVERLKQELSDKISELEVAKTKINRTQINLGIDDLEDLETELKNELGTKLTLKEWKEELKMEKEHSKNMDNFYRQQFPLDNNLEHVRNELSRQILEVNREKRQKDQEINELKNSAAQTRDVFLFEKIENKYNQLEQLKTNIRNGLNENWHETLEDVLETQKAFIQNNSELNLNQLRRFKQRLLNNGQIIQEELNKICQVQAELSFLELKLEREHKFQAQIEINRNS